MKYNDMKDLFALDNPILVKVDNMYLKNVILPYLELYPKTKNEYITLCLTTKSRINNSYAEIIAITNSIDSMIKCNDIDNNKKRFLSQLKYSIIRNYLDVCAYTTGMLIRKIKFYMFNIQSYMNLYDTMDNFFPEGRPQFTEAVIDGNLKDIGHCFQCG